jgi:hypothetical protein
MVFSSNKKQLPLLSVNSFLPLYEGELFALLLFNKGVGGMLYASFVEGGG